VLVGRVGTFSAVVGAVYGLGSTGGRFGAALIGTFDGLTIGLALAAIGTFILDAPVGAPVRRLPVAAAMSLRASIYVLVIAGGLQLGETLSIVSQVGVRADSDATPNLFFALFVATIISIVQTLRRIIGPGLLPLLAGRYRHPQEEERAVLFLDVRDSTPIAEQLGNKRFVQFLDEVIFTATEPIMEAGGEIYKYVGDEIIATWPMRGPGAARPRQAGEYRLLHQGGDPNGAHRDQSARQARYLHARPGGARRLRRCVPRSRSPISSAPRALLIGPSMPGI
jgi:adenylate cyclase